MKDDLIQFHLSTEAASAQAQKELQPTFIQQKVHINNCPAKLC